MEPDDEKTQYHVVLTKGTMVSADEQRYLSIASVRSSPGSTDNIEIVIN
jgi:hypothetical protein